MKRLFLPLLALSLILLLGVAAFLWLPGLVGPPEFAGTLLADPEPAPAFALTDVAGNLVAPGDFEDQIVLLYFGYTFCPDVCPTTMADLARVQREVDDDGDEVQVIMITVDPGRDTAAVVHDYATSFHSDFVGLSGTEAEIAAAAAAWGVYYQKQQGTAATGYLVDHTARVFLIDKAGRYRLTYPFGTAPEAIAADIEILLDE